MHERLKALRKALNLTQQEFADALHVQRGTIGNYEVGRNEPVDSVIALICREFDVNETWLRTGDGEMFRSISREEEIALTVGRLLKGEDNFRRRFIAALCRLPSEHWDALEDVFSRISDEIKKEQ
jgi:transcriptional regulator with XRE-family HTH domain